jgi:hypothetical protein
MINLIIIDIKYFLPLLELTFLLEFMSVKSVHVTSKVS